MTVGNALYKLVIERHPLLLMYRLTTANRRLFANANAWKQIRARCKTYTYEKGLQLRLFGRTKANKNGVYVMYAALEVMLASVGHKEGCSSSHLKILRGTPDTTDTIPMTIGFSPIPHLPQTRKRILDFYGTSLAGYLLFCHASSRQRTLTYTQDTSLSSNNSPAGAALPVNQS